MSTKRGSQTGNSSSTQPQPKTTSPAARPWLWFRSQPGGRSRAEEEFQSLPAVGRAELAAKIDRYRRGESRRREVDSLGDGILEIRHREQTVRFRILFMNWGPCSVGLTAFCKKEPKTPAADLDRAKTRAKRWKEVNGKEPDGTPPP
jgi:phage-related protein